MTRSSVRVIGALALAASLSVASAARPFTARALLETGAELRTNCGTVQAVVRTSCDTVWTDTFFDKCEATKAYDQAVAADGTWKVAADATSVTLAAKEAKDAIDQVASGKALPDIYISFQVCFSQPSQVRHVTDTHYEPRFLS